MSKEMNNIEFVIKENIKFKSKDIKYRFIKKIRENKLDDITSQLIELFVSSLSNKTINNTVINNIMPTPIPEIKQVKEKKEDSDTEEKEETVSINKYKKVIDLKNKYYKEMNEKDIIIEKLKEQLKDKENAVKPSRAFDNNLFDEISSSESDDDDDYNPYNKPDIKINISDSESEEEKQESDMILSEQEIKDYIALEKLKDFKDENINVTKLKYDKSK